MALMRSAASSPAPVHAGNEDGAVLLDVDRGARVLLDAANDLAAGADDVANLVRGNLPG